MDRDCDSWSFNNFSHSSLTFSPMAYPVHYLKEEEFRIIAQSQRSILSSRLPFSSCMEYHLSTILVPCAAVPRLCGAAAVRVPGTARQNTSTTSALYCCWMNLWWPSIFQDWPRHRAECIPAMSPTNCYNVNMIATPPPAEPQFVNVSAILFSPEEGELNESILPASMTNASASRKTKNRHCQLSTFAKGFSRNVPHSDSWLLFRRPASAGYCLDPRP